MTQDQIDGITKARLVANIANASDPAKQIATDADYIAYVCKMAGIDTLPDEALDSYVAQHAGESIEGLELRLADALEGAPVEAPQPAEEPPYEVIMDASGLVVGPFNGEALTDGQWTRKSNAANEMLPLTFLDKLGAQNYITIQQVAAKNLALLFLTARGLAARSIHIEESFPSLIQMEKAGIIPVGTAIAIWS